MTHPVLLCSGRRKAAFTLIEVLVVVAIIALLVSILLPSLTQAREQAKIVRCLANLGNLAKACSGYITANRDRFCFGPKYPLASGGLPYTRTWYFGGNRGQSSSKLGTNGYYVENSSHDWGPRERPLNKFVYTAAKFGADRRPLRTPGTLRLFECPSDLGVRWDGDPNSKLKEVVSAYLEVGSSYAANHAWRYYITDYEAAKMGVGAAGRVSQMLDRFVPVMEGKGPSRVILLYEDTADWALCTADAFPAKFKVRSWHNKLDIHNLMFLDGHADQRHVDWSKNLTSIDKAGTASWIARHYYSDQ